MRGFLNLNDENTNYALISPIGSVDGNLDGEKSTILLSSIESQQEKNGDQHTDVSFVGAASIENETETSEDGIKACVAPIENETAQEERMDETKSIDIEIVTVDPASRPAKQANDSTSPMAVVVDDTENNQTAPSNHCFDVGEYVRVVKGGHKNFGACGKIQKRTKCYVFFLDESTKSTIKITPQFLEDASSNNSVSTASTVSTSYSDRNVKSAISLGGIDGVGACEGFPGVGLPGAVSSFGLSVEKICFSGNSIKITNAFSNIWDVGSYLPPIEISLELKDPADLPLKLPLDKVYELYYAEVGDDKSGYSSYTKSKKVTAHYVCSESLREHEEKLADFGTLSPSKVWARRKHYLSPAMKLNKEFAVKHISANDLTMIEDVGTVGCGFIQDKYLEDLLGNNAQAKRALGIQIRIFEFFQALVKLASSFDVRP